MSHQHHASGGGWHGGHGGHSHHHRPYHHHFSGGTVPVYPWGWPYPAYPYYGTYPTHGACVSLCDSDAYNCMANPYVPNKTDCWVNRQYCVGACGRWW